MNDMSLLLAKLKFEISNSNNLLQFFECSGCVLNFFCIKIINV